MDIKEGFDKTKYNFLNRAKDIHTFQVMGRGFNIISRYDKVDLSLFDKGTPEYKDAELKNKRSEGESTSAKELLNGVIADNGGKGIFLNMAAVASAYGVGIIKKYRDGNDIKLVSIESPQNFVAGWSSTNFRERDFDAITYRISVASATRLYGDKLKKGESFLADNASIYSTSLVEPTSRKMLTCIDFVGRDSEINDGEIFNALIVGDKLVGYETNKKFIPKFYIFQNRERLQRPWGASDISDEAIDLNRTYIAQMSDSLTLLKKMFPFIEARGFESTNLPKKDSGAMQVFPIGLDQEMNIKQFQPGVYPYKTMLDEIKESLFRVLGLGRVMIDDPTVSFESNQALMTGMKSTIDIAEDKQSRWERTLVELFTDIVEELKDLSPETKKLIGDSVELDIEWPSVLRKEDASYNTMLLNNVRGGLISLETYLEKIGTQNVSEEIDRIKSEMKDPILGAILSANLRMVNQLEIMPQQPAQGQQSTNAPLTTDQNQGTQPMSQAGSGAPAVSAEGAQATLNQNNGQ
jgi:hypothetical protein